MILTMCKREKFISQQRKAQLKVILEQKRVFDARTYSDKLTEAINNKDQEEALQIQTQIYTNYHIEIVKAEYIELAFRQLQLNFEKCYCVIFSLLTELIDYQTKFNQNFLKEIIDQSIEMLNLELDYNTDQAYHIFINAILNGDKKKITKFCDSGLIQNFLKIQQKYAYDPKLLIHRVILDSIHMISSKNQLYLHQANLVELIGTILERALELQICEDELKGCLMYINSQRINYLLQNWLESQNKYYVAFALEIFRVQEKRLTKQQIKHALSFNVRKLVEEVVKNLPIDDLDVDINSMLYESFLDHSSDLKHQRLLTYTIDINYFDEIRRDEYIKYVFHSEDEEMIKNILPQFDGEDVLEHINLLEGLKNRDIYSDEVMELATNLIHENGFE